jgi:hypothetical protein
MPDHAIVLVNGWQQSPTQTRPEAESTRVDENHAAWLLNRHPAHGYVRRRVVEDGNARY